MAIDANRIKYSSNISSFFSLLWSLIKKLLVLGICLGAAQLLYLPPTHKISVASLEISGRVMSAGVDIYNHLLHPINYVKDHLSLLNDLKTENIELKLKLEKFKDLETNTQILESENNEFRKILKVIPDTKYKQKIARLLSISLNPFSRTMLIGAGTNDGIDIDYIVSSSKGLVGRVIQVSENYAKVMLINDLNSRVPIIGSMSHERAILVGDGDKLNLTYLSDPKMIQESEILLTSGDGKIYPYGIPVAEVIKNDGSRIILKSMMDLNKTEFVHIYTPINK